jgi:aminocarboxymuconate-semialdehyde decarboxylase
VLPTLGWRIAALLDLRGAEDADVTADHIADVLRGSHYDSALAASPNSLLPILEVSGHDHILFGTGYPAAPAPAIDRNIENLMRSDGLTDDQRADIERANAIRLFPRLRSCRAWRSQPSDRLQRSHGQLVPCARNSPDGDAHRRRGDL